MHPEIHSLRFHVSSTRDSVSDTIPIEDLVKAGRPSQDKCASCGGRKERGTKCKHPLAVQNGWKEINCEVRSDLCAK